MEYNCNTAATAAHRVNFFRTDSQPFQYAKGEEEIHATFRGDIRHFYFARTASCPSGSLQNYENLPKDTKITLKNSRKIFFERNREKRKTLIISNIQR